MQDIPAGAIAHVSFTLDGAPEEHTADIAIEPGGTYTIGGLCVFRIPWPIEMSLIPSMAVVVRGPDGRNLFAVNEDAELAMRWSTGDLVELEGEAGPVAEGVDATL